MYLAGLCGCLQKALVGEESHGLFHSSGQAYTCTVVVLRVKGQRKGVFWVQSWSGGRTETLPCRDADSSCYG